MLCNLLQSFRRRGGGGYSENNTGAGVPWHTKKGGLMCGYSSKGGLRYGHNQKNGVLGTATTRKKGEFGTVFCSVLGTEVAQKGGLRSLFILFIIFTFTYQHNQLIGCVLAD